MGKKTNPINTFCFTSKYFQQASYISSIEILSVTSGSINRSDSIQKSALRIKSLVFVRNVISKHDILYITSYYWYFIQQNVPGNSLKIYIYWQSKQKVFCRIKRLRWHLKSDVKSGRYNEMHNEYTRDAESQIRSKYGWLIKARRFMSK